MLPTDEVLRAGRGQQTRSPRRDEREQSAVHMRVSKGRCGQHADHRRGPERGAWTASCPQMRSKGG
eukprot:2634773-Pyramimonas_sp.AAC.1